MATEVILPKVDMDMDEGTLAVWHVEEGASVNEGDPLFDIETDKAAMEVEAPATGILRRVSAQPGDRLPVGTVIGWIYAEGEEVAEAPAAGAKAEAPETPAAAPVAAVATPAPVVEASSAAPDVAGDGEKIRATPMARRVARLAGVTLAGIRGSGPRGRIQRADVEAAVAASSSVTPAGATAAAASEAATDGLSTEEVRQLLAGRAYEEVTLDNMRRTIAARLSAAKRTVPHFYLHREVEVDALLEFRRDLNARLAARGARISLNDLIIKACALALQQVPECNAVWAGDRIFRLRASDIAVAVAVEGGLFTPVLRDAETKALTALSAEMKDLAARARARKLAPPDYQGGSFAISNLGMYGVDSFEAVINPPHGAILAVGAARRRPVLDEAGEFAKATVLRLTLSVDHRVIDGASGAAFLGAIADCLRDPLGMVA